MARANRFHAANFYSTPPTNAVLRLSSGGNRLSSVFGDYNTDGQFVSNNVGTEFAASGTATSIASSRMD